MTPRVLILGGTAEARDLAAELVARPGVNVVSSLAGRVSRPRLPAGRVRIGGFGGPEALAHWLRHEGVAAVVDATHPFAERISRVRRPGRRRRRRAAGRPDAARVDAGSRRSLDLGQLARGGRRGAPGVGAPRLPHHGAAGAGGLRRARRALVPRAVRGSAGLRPPPRHLLILDRGPYTLAGELTLFDAHGIDLLVSKDSGGGQVAAKLAAARERGAPVVMVRRPGRPEVPAVATVAEAVAWLGARGALSPGGDGAYRPSAPGRGG